MLTGGEESSLSAELYIPALNQHCSLPDLPGPRYGHGHLGSVLCGGMNYDTDAYYSDCVRSVPYKPFAISLYGRRAPSFLVLHPIIMSLWESRHCIVLCCIVLCCTVLYCTVQVQ